MKKATRLRALLQSLTLLVGAYVCIATELEAINVGIFLNSLMQLYQRWLVILPPLSAPHTPRN